MEKKLLMIVNPVAGTKRLRPHLLDVISVFSTGGFATTVMVTGRRGDAAAFAAHGIFAKFIHLISHLFPARATIFRESAKC